MADSEQSRLVSLSISVYRRLLLLYPRRHRLEYGPLMAQAFGDLCRDAWHRGGTFGVLHLWLRALPDVAWNVAREHASAAGGALLAIGDQAVAPLPWPQVGLAALPGLGILAGTPLAAQVLGPLAGLSLPGDVPAIPALLIGLPLLLAGLSFLRRRRFPAWGLTALAVLPLRLQMLGPLPVVWLLTLLGLPFVAFYVLLLWAPREGMSRWPGIALVASIAMSFVPKLASMADLWALWAVIASYGFVFLSLRLARQHGLAAGLLILGALPSLWEWPLYAQWQEAFGIASGRTEFLWEQAMLPVMALLLLVVAPVCALRARSLHRQAWGLLAPAAIALTTVMTLSPVVASRAGRAVSPFGIGVYLLQEAKSAAQLITPMVLALWLYRGLPDRGEAQSTE